jgi:hypothetical protein
MFNVSSFFLSAWACVAKEIKQGEKKSSQLVIFFITNEVKVYGRGNRSYYDVVRTGFGNNTNLAVTY